MPPDHKRARTTTTTAATGGGDHHQLAVRPPPAASDLVAADGDRMVAVLAAALALGDRDPRAGVNHLWILREALGLPVALLERLHASLAVDLAERVAPLTPRATVRAYRCGDLELPLLCWFPHQRTAAVCMLQEFLHVAYGGHVPECRVWHWMVLPFNAVVNLVGRRFEEAGLWPSWRGLVRYAAPPTVVGGSSNADVPFDALEAHGARLAMDPLRTHMHTAYGGGAVAVWLGEDVLFVVDTTVAPGGDAATAVRLPERCADLPPWVVSLLVERTHGALDEQAVRRNVDAYLEWFARRPIGAALTLLRAVGWHHLPLVWRPVFLRGDHAVPRVTMRESADAQARVVKGVAAVWDDAETVAEAVAVLHRLTGLPPDA